MKKMIFYRGGEEMEAVIVFCTLLMVCAFVGILSFFAARVYISQTNTIKLLEEAGENMEEVIFKLKEENSDLGHRLAQATTPFAPEYNTRTGWEDIDYGR